MEDLPTEQQNIAVMTPQQMSAMMETVLLHGDLSKLASKDRVNYYNKVCDSLALNP
jgi:hypothetical protein